MDSQKLTEENQLEIKKFLLFLKSKKEDSLKEIDLDYNEFIQDNLSQDGVVIYNSEDVKKMFKNFCSQIKKSVDNDLSLSSRMAGVYIKMLMLEGQSKNVEFEANLNILEDIRLIEQMKSIEIGEGYKSEIGNIESKLQQTNIFAKKVAQKLPNLMSGQTSNNNNEELQKKIEELEKQLSNYQSGVDENNPYQNEIHDLKQKIQDMEQEYEGVKSDLDKKLNESVQVNNLKKMIQQKNTQVKDLQMKLKQLENQK